MPPLQDAKKKWNEWRLKLTDMSYSNLVRNLMLLDADASRLDRALQDIARFEAIAAAQRDPTLKQWRARINDQANAIQSSQQQISELHQTNQQLTATIEKVTQEKAQTSQQLVGPLYCLLGTRTCSQTRLHLLICSVQVSLTQELASRSHIKSELVALHNQFSALKAVGWVPVQWSASGPLVLSFHEHFHWTVEFGATPDAIANSAIAVAPKHATNQVPDPMFWFCQSVEDSRIGGFRRFGE